MNNLNELSKEIYEGNKLRGFDVSKENIGQTLMLVVSELAEALEADRKAKYANLEVFENCMAADDINEGDMDLYVYQSFQETIKDTFQDEIADSFIRLFDLVGGLQIDIEKHIKYKLEYNSKREFKHGKRY
jgi:NTP pyrophosphatase (non-canonical NTP hydrolase)